MLSMKIPHIVNKPVQYHVRLGDRPYLTRTSCPFTPNSPSPSDNLSFGSANMS